MVATDCIEREAGAASARILGVLERLGRRWPDGGPGANPAVWQNVQPHLERLKEADRALNRASLDARFAEARVTILSRAVAKHVQRRDDLVQQVLHTKFQAASQRSSSGEAQLRRIAGEWEEDLRDFDASFGHRPQELIEARRKSREKRAHLRLLRKRVVDLEDAIGRFFPLIVREVRAPEETGPDSSPDGETRQGVNGRATFAITDEPAEPSKSDFAAARAGAEVAPRRTRGRRVIRRRVWRMRRPPRAFRGGIVRSNRR